MSKSGESQLVGRIVLNALYATAGDGNTFGLTHEQMMHGLHSSALIVSDDAIRMELQDLIDLNLIERKGSADFGPYYSITARGRAFWRASMPWHKIDEFAPPPGAEFRP